MKKVLLTLVFGMMTMVGFGQIIKITVDKSQHFTHSSLINTSDAAENGLLNYGKGGRVDMDYIFDLDKKELKQICRFTPFEETFKIKEVYRTSNLIDVITEGEDGEYLCVLGTQKGDGKKVLIIEKIDGNNVDGWFHPEPKIEIIKPQE